jgi:hypothetical protein
VLASVLFCLKEEIMKILKHLWILPLAIVVVLTPSWIKTIVEPSLPVWAQSINYPPTPMGAFLSPSAGVWNPWTSAQSFGSINYVPLPIALFCQASVGAKWAPCNPGSSGAGVSSFTGDGTIFNNSASTGAVTATLANAAQNSVLAGPSSGGAGAPSYQTAPTLQGLTIAHPAATGVFFTAGNTTGSYGGFQIQSTSGVTVFQANNSSLPTYTPFMEVAASVFPSMNLGPIPWAWGYLVSCATGFPGNGCVGGVFQATANRDLLLSGYTDGTSPVAFTVIGTETTSVSLGSPLHLATGTKFSVTGCGTATSLVGGSTAGSFVGGSATCTPVITTNVTATHGYSCWMNDETTTSVKFQETAQSTIAVTFTATGTLGATDSIDFGCLAY